MKLPIITVPDPQLRTVSKPVDVLDKKHFKFIANLGETLAKKNNPPGVGLSAIQVDSPLRAFYTFLPPGNDSNDFPTGRNFQLQAFINPKIVGHSKEITLGPDTKKPLLEGCLSIPSLYGPVYRWQWIDIEFDSFNFSSYQVSQSTNPQKRLQRFSGFPARVVQHEYDHLDGILFTDYILGTSPASAFNSLGQAGPLYFDTGDQLQEVADPQALIKW
jgi:peptide deformylase